MSDEESSTSEVPRQADPNQLVIQEAVASWQAPLPPPAFLREYAEIDPSYPERIMAMAERQVGMAERDLIHRHESETREQLHQHTEEQKLNRALRNSVLRAQGGIILIALSALALAAYLAHIEANPVLTGAFGLAGLVTPAFYALWGSRIQSRSDDD